MDRQKTLNAGSSNRSTSREEMMRFHAIRNLLVAGASAVTLAACGGGGSPAFIPKAPITPPPPPPPPATAELGFIVAAAVPDQPFARMGGIVRPDSNQIAGVSTAQSDQAQLRYDSPSGQYQIQVPAGSSWEKLFYNPDQGNFYTQNNSPFIRFPESAATGYHYSALSTLFQGPSPVGVYAAGNAFGIPTPAGGVPTTGSATYNGSIAGFTTETVSEWGSWGAAQVNGNIALSFSFGGGTLSGTISPNINTYALAPLSFTNTVFAPGSTTFSGTFSTALPGANSFSGQFTGPAAQELIGSFVFPYTSPANGIVFHATGGFVAKQ
jgi:hypothetical protein